MFNPRDTFHKISYLQYPSLLIAMFYSFKPYFVGLDTLIENYNFALIFMGLGISLSTLQDTTKTQNKMSLKIWQDPKKGKRVLIGIAIMAVLLITFGLFGLYITKSEVIKQLSIGTIVLGIGVIGLLKSAIEMFENHRLDKH